MASGAKTASLCIFRSVQLPNRTFCAGFPKRARSHMKPMERTSLKFNRHLTKNEDISASLTQQLCDLLAFSWASVAWPELLANLPWLMAVAIYSRSGLVQDADILICTVDLGQAKKNLGVILVWVLERFQKVWSESRFADLLALGLPRPA